MYLTELCRFYDRMVQAGAPGMPPQGMTSEQISFVLVINEDGEVCGSPLDIRTSEGRPQRLFVPASVKRSVNIAPNFLWDKTDYVLGVFDPTELEELPEDQKETARKKKETRTRAAHAAFVQYHKDRLKNCNDVRARALLNFLNRWNPEDIGRLSVAEDFFGANFVFKLQGEDNYLHDCEAMRELLVDGVVLGAAVK